MDVSVLQSAATELVNADRASLFLVDSEREDLYAHVFSVSPSEGDCVDRVLVESKPSCVDDYIKQLGSTLQEVVSYNGKLIRSGRLCVCYFFQARQLCIYKQFGLDDIRYSY